MPLSHDPELSLSLSNKEKQAKPSSHPYPSVTAMRKPSEESIRTEFCDGPEPDPPEWIQALEERAAHIAAKEEGNKTSDRAELIRRIKRGESPTWVPSQALENEYLKQDSVMPASPEQNAKRKKDLLPLFPPLDISRSERPQSTSQTVLSPQAEIRRPKSALHTGNFTEGSDSSGQDLFDRSDEPSEGAWDTSPTTPLYPPAPWRPSVAHENQLSDEREAEWLERRSFRSRPPSLQSFSSSYVLKAPTTPLVQQSNSTDLELSTISPIALSESPREESRRHTLPLHALSSSFHDPSSPFSAYQPLSNRIDNRLPHQRHRSQRSLTEKWSLQVATSPQPSRCLGSRRLSNSSEVSSRRRASMVGSYEESILRGSMSTAPSKPLDFTAQIGVLGKDNCKPKCPAHVTVPFPAVFYSYSSGDGRQTIADEPSPYVGLIDIQQLLPAAEPGRRRRKRHHSPDVQNSESRRVNGEQSRDKQDAEEEEEGSLQIRKRRKRRAESPIQDVPPGGSYRIPQIGQLQIIIKNPNKTAVKLFLVPYDLTGMESGTKTFIRQRCYCSDSPVDGALTSKSDDAKRASTSHEATKKPSLRYLIHVNICCPSKGTFYLYHQIRVVFANRVPDNKEQLQNDIQIPDPRFSPYNPLRESLTPRSAGGAQLTADKAFRRRSAGFGSESDAIGSRYTQSLGSNSDYQFGSATPAPPVPPIPFDLVMPKPRPNPDVSDAETSRPTTATDSQSPTSDRKGHLRNNAFGSFRSNSSNGSDSYAKLNKADTSNGGVYGRPNTPEPGAGLLARKLRGFALQRGEVFDDE